MFCTGTYVYCAANSDHCPALFANHTFVLSFGFEKDKAGFFIWKTLLKLQNIHGQKSFFDQVTYK
jgi:hypothetical protein